MGKKWVIRSYRDGDEEGIFELWKAVFTDRQFDKEQWLKWWHWMYKENPAGKSWILLAEDNGKIVSQAPKIPYFIKIGETTVFGEQGIDSMTHPEYRNRGIRQKVSDDTVDIAVKDGVQIGYGFPNENLYPIVKKLPDRIDLGKMQTIFKPFNWRHAFKSRIKNKYVRTIVAMGAGLIFKILFWRVRKPPIVEDLSLKRINLFDERFDDLWARICNQARIMVVRNSAYLNWRYSTPGVSYSIFAAEKDQKISGYIVFQHKEEDDVKTSVIFDVIAESEVIMHHLIAETVKECRHMGSDVILYHLLTNNTLTNQTYFRTFKHNGFISLPFLKNIHFRLNYHSPLISEEFLSNPDNWMVQLGDSDAT